MKIKEEYPPNYEDIKRVLKVEGIKMIYTYGDTIYNPDKCIVTPDLYVHEGVHERQQGDNPAQWWEKYLSDASFRLEQEIQAYGEQYLFVKRNFPVRIYDESRTKIALALSGAEYGNMIPFWKAEVTLRKYAN